MTAPDDVCARFEAWLTKRHGLSTERWADSGNYKYGDTRAWWECWQAAHADMPGEVREFVNRLRKLSVAVIAPAPRRTRADERRWSRELDTIADALAKFAHQEPQA